ncbi:uncharacterized protein LOC129722057 isoform X2 [Wyeomyia smithii]|nr:uncharacterized protein LOC129722057 isoform X2 [Wyeomyia smithii]
MDPNLRTLSLAAWMSLPGLPFTEWEKHHPPVVDPFEHPYLPPTETEEGVKILKSNNQHGASMNRNRKILTGSSSASSNRSFNTECDRCIGLNRQQPQRPKVSLICSRCRAINSAIALENPDSTRQQQTSVVYQERNGKVNTKLYPPRRNLSLKRQLSKEVETRALISRVAQYYESYVEEMQLSKYFMNDTVVTTVLPLDLSAVGGPIADHLRNGRWIVSGFDRHTGKRFTVVCQNLVLANGASDLANRLGIKGEGLDMPWVKYELPHLERELEQYDDGAMAHLKPVLIVGAGLSAADAVTICRSSGIPVVHVYRSRTAGLDKMLPGNVYPEYHEVHKMMKDSNRRYELYTPLPEHTIADLSQGPNDSHRVIVQHLKTGERREIEVSFCAILIGSRPDLRFMSGLTKSGYTLPQNGHENGSVNHRHQSTAIVVEETENNPRENRSLQPVTIWSITEHLLTSRLGRKLFWFKNICAKCRHLNVCDRNNRYKHYQPAATTGVIEERNLPNCGQNLSLLGKSCGCKLLTATPAVNDHQALASGLGLGENQNKPIDCKSNPIEVDKYSNAVLRTPHKGLYAMGPLVGDNFVRFIPGGALSITSALHKRAEND